MDFVCGNMKEKRINVFLFLLGGLILLVSAYFSEGYFQADEHYQIIEFANYKLGAITAEQLPWEFAAQMRPGFQPLIAFLLIKGLGALGVSNPFIQIMCLRLLTALVVLFSIIYFLRRVQIIAAPLMRRVLVIILFFLMWFMPLLMVRFSSENFSAIFIFITIAILFGDKYDLRLKHFLWAGLTAGLAFLFRYQSSVMIAGLVLWMLFILKPGWKKLLCFVMIAGLVSCLGFLCDRWLYGEWVCAPWNYFSNNILQDKLSTFGVKPWHHYFSSGSEQLFLPLGIVVWFSIAVFWIRRFKSPITWISLPFVLFHVVLSHKEVRFLFPLLLFIPIIILDTAQWMAGFRLLRSMKVRYIILVCFCVVNAVFLSMFITKPMNQYVGVMSRINATHSKNKVLYYLGNNPEKPFGMPPWFYATDGVNSRVLPDTIKDNLPQSSADTTVFVFEEMKGLDYSTQADIERVLCKFPRWMKYLNIGNWQQRTSNWVLYQSKATQPMR